MGTRSLTHIKDEKNKTLLTVYRQYDGYPTGIGDDIKRILNNGNVNIINGISGQNSPEAFNGMGCLAAYLVGELKERSIGNVYVEVPNSANLGEDYVYTLTQKDDTVNVQVYDPFYKKVLYSGLLSEFDGELVESQNSEEDEE